MTKLRAAAALLVLTLAVPTANAMPSPGGGSGGFQPSDMDKGAAACQDFYQYAVGGWLKANPIPADYPSWGAFNELNERNREALHQILERLAARPAAPKAPRSASSATSGRAAWTRPRSKRRARGRSKTSSRGSPQSRTSRPCRPRSRGSRPTGSNAVFQYGSEPDRKDSAKVIAAAFQGGLGLPDRDYYTKTDKESKDLRAKYVAHVAKMLVLLGEKKAAAAAHARTVLAFETKLALASMTRVEQRDSDRHLQQDERGRPSRS